MRRRIAIFLMIVCLITILPIGTVNAAEMSAGTVTTFVPDITIQMAYTSFMRTDLSITASGTAYCAAVFDGYPGITTKVTITMTLQKKGFLGLWWTEVATWTDTFYKPYASVQHNYYGLSGGTYRVKGVYTAYSGSNSETHTAYSRELSY
ncbi:MAG TPA: hypothetical protein PKO35_01460 [Candidatus Atribacteria bacterium]|nr:hypothetical protein [Candidatus Atribacteria bacterium]